MRLLKIGTKALISFYRVNLIDFFVNIPSLFWIRYRQSFSNWLGKGATKESGFTKPAIHLGNKLHVATCVYSLHYNMILFFRWLVLKQFIRRSCKVQEFCSTFDPVIADPLFDQLCETIFSHTPTCADTSKRQQGNGGRREHRKWKSKRAAATLLKIFAILYSLRMTLLWSTWALTKKTIQARLCRLCKDRRHLVDNILFNAFNSH